LQTRRFVYITRDDVIARDTQTSSLFILEDGVKFNIMGRCQPSLSLIIMSSDEVGSFGLFTAGLQPLQASVAWTQPVRPLSHTF